LIDGRRAVVSGSDKDEKIIICSDKPEQNNEIGREETKGRPRHSDRSIA
jgi:hypothetical protein